MIISGKAVSCGWCLQEKLKGKNKLETRLLGITKESIIRVNARTKEVNTIAHFRSDVIRIQSMP